MGQIQVKDQAPRDNQSESIEETDSAASSESSLRNMQYTARSDSNDTLNLEHVEPGLSKKSSLIPT